MYSAKKPLRHAAKHTPIKRLGRIAVAAERKDLVDRLPVDDGRGDDDRQAARIPMPLLPLALADEAKHVQPIKPWHHEIEHGK